MLQKRTVFILGAGASIDYGYPAGTELREDILRKAHIPFSWKTNTNGLGKVSEVVPLPNGIDRIAFLHYNCGFPFEFLDQFRNDFDNSPRNSIDAFLEDRPEFLQLGKMLIAMSIFGYERFISKESHGYSQQWYRYLFNAMAPNWEAFKKNSISVITYNYDRSFETYFIKFLMSTFGRSFQECLETFSQVVTQIHVHGSIAATLPFVPEAKQYDGQIIGEHVRQAASQLKIIHEEVNYEPIHEILNKASIVFILGFGFDDRNLKRLNIADCPAKIFATRTNITDLNVRQISDSVKSKIRFTPNKDAKIVDFFENDVSFLGKTGRHMLYPEYARR